MRWLPVLLAAAVLPLGALFAFACSNGDPSTSVGSMDASQPPPTKFEAGANCASTNDCETGLVCLFPAGPTFTCNTLAVCVATPMCTKSLTACSCLAEPIEVCGGYAQNPVDPTGTCDAGTVVIPSEDGGDDGGSVAQPDGSSDAAAIADATDDGG